MSCRLTSSLFLFALYVTLIPIFIPYTRCLKVSPALPVLLAATSGPCKCPWGSRIALLAGIPVTHMPTYLKSKCLSFMSMYHSRHQLPFQSLHHMNVPHRHCVPTSLCPVGPIGLGHIQNCLPRFIPGFFVVIEMQGSPCSHRGTGFLEKSFVQSSFDASWEARGSASKESESMGDWGGGISVLDWLGASLVAAGEAGANESLGGSASVGLLCGWKKPFSDC